MKTPGLVLASLLVAAACPVAQAGDPPNFDFLGHVVSVPAATGQLLVMYGVINNNGVVPTPIPLDFQNAEHTLVVEGTLASTAGSSQSYAPTTVRIYSDLGPSTLHDFATPSTFTDGILILAGDVSGSLTRLVFSSTLGSFVGSVLWTGGVRLGELAENTSGWAFGGGWSRQTLRPVGYQETWDGKVDQAVIAVQATTWGGVKALYRP